MASKKIRIYNRCWKAEDYNRFGAAAKSVSELGAFFVFDGASSRFLTIPGIGLVYTAKFYQDEVEAADALADRLGITNYMTEYVEERNRRAEAAAGSLF